MFKLVKNIYNFQKLQVTKQLCRTFLSQAYYCNELWEQRLQDPVLQNINPDELYNEIDVNFQKTRNVSAVDVDIFAHIVKDETYVDELLDVLHKLRISADTCNTLNSTSHAVIRYLMGIGKTVQLANVLDDRLNYGIFLDDFSINILLDTLWKNKDYTTGARVGSQLMLQEDFKHPLSISLSLLHFYNYLLYPSEWPQPPKPVEPEDDIKIRVNYLRNPFDDEHFDLRDPNKIVGKSLMMMCKGLKDPIEKSFHLLGLVLFEQHDKAKSVIQNLLSNNDKIYNDVLNLIPENNPIRAEIKDIQSDSTNVQELLQNFVKSTVDDMSEQDISVQSKTYAKWSEERKMALERQMQRLLTAKRLANIEDLQQKMKDKELLLWFFENEEQIELAIEEKKIDQTPVVEKKKHKVDETYVPPEIVKMKH